MKENNKKHSENADTSTSVTFDLEMPLNPAPSYNVGAHQGIAWGYGKLYGSEYETIGEGSANRKVKRCVFRSYHLDFGLLGDSMGLNM